MIPEKEKKKKDLIKCVESALQTWGSVVRIWLGPHIGPRRMLPPSPVFRIPGSGREAAISPSYFLLEMVVRRLVAANRGIYN